MLTSRDDRGAHLDLLADVGRTFRDPKIVAQVHATKTYTEFHACVRSESVPEDDS